MFRPKLVSLDTASWDLLTKEQNDAARRVLNLFASGSVIPFFTSTHLDELMQHGNRTVVDARQAMLRRLRFVTYLQGCNSGHGDVGWLLDLREAEMGVLCEVRGATTDVVLERVRETIVNRFCSGAELYERNIEQWEWYRQLAPAFRNTPEVASLAQFPLPGVNLKERIPASSDDVEFRTAEEMRRVLFNQFDWLVDKLKTDGDPRLKDHEKVAAKFLREIVEDSEPLVNSPGDLLEKLLAQAGVERSRLPPNPTIEDVGYEATFAGHFRVHERRLRLPVGTLKQFVRQEQVPSWIVWREVDRTMKRLRKAEGSSLADKWMVPFALYVDKFETDKRVCHCIREALPSHPLLKIVHARIFRRSSLEDLAGKLEALAGA